MAETLQRILEQMQTMQLEGGERSKKSDEKIDFLFEQIKALAENQKSLERLQGDQAYLPGQPALPLVLPPPPTSADYPFSDSEKFSGDPTKLFAFLFEVRHCLLLAPNRFHDEGRNIVFFGSRLAGAAHAWFP